MKTTVMFAVTSFNLIDTKVPDPPAVSIFILKTGRDGASDKIPQEITVRLHGVSPKPQ
jgi:hypothetical protein